MTDDQHDADLDHRPAWWSPEAWDYDSAGRDRELTIFFDNGTTDEKATLRAQLDITLLANQMTERLESGHPKSEITAMANRLKAAKESAWNSWLVDFSPLEPFCSD